MSNNLGSSTSLSSLISPTKARRDAAEAKDWAYVSTWLANKYHPQPVPRFEHNTDTLNVLLGLVGANEAADGEIDLIQRAQQAELSAYEEPQQRPAGPCRLILEALEEHLDERGRDALKDLAGASIALGTLSPDPIVMADRIIELSQEKYEMEEQRRRIDGLQRQLEKEMEGMRNGIESIQSQVDEVEQEDIQQRTLRLNQENKQLTIKAGEYNERIAGLERYKVTSPSIKEVRAMEQKIKHLQARVKKMEDVLSNFQGLPPDLGTAREIYQGAAKEFQSLLQQRDSLPE